MTRLTKRSSAKGFTLIETMVALGILAFGILGLAAMLGDAMAYMEGSQYDYIAQQKAEEAAEAIFTAKYNNPNNWATINNTSANPPGLFLVGPLPLRQPSPTGLVGTADDAAAPLEAITLPGPDGKLGTADDVQMPLNNFTRTIAINPVAGNTNLRQIVITVNYSAGRFFNRQYVLTTYISSFN